MKRPYGMAQEAFNCYVRGCFAAHIDPDRVMQTIGDAPASAGYHLKDGEDAYGHDYCAAVDIRVKDLTRAQKHELLEQLAIQGFAGWWRDWPGNEHAHVVYAGLKMKPQLRGQIHDWLHGLNGLAGHQEDEFMVPSEWAKQHVRTMFLEDNPANG